MIEKSQNIDLEVNFFFWKCVVDNRKWKPLEKEKYPLIKKVVSRYWKSSARPFKNNKFQSSKAATSIKKSTSTLKSATTKSHKIWLIIAAPPYIFSSFHPFDHFAQTPITQEISSQNTLCLLKISPFLKARSPTLTF